MSPNGLQLSSTANESVALSNDIANFINFGTSPGAASTGSGGSHARVNQANIRSANGFPISAAFKKGVDTLTRSGCSEYTVRGRLHWLGVMKDWNWQGMLSSIYDGSNADSSRSYVRLKHVRHEMYERRCLLFLPSFVHHISHCSRHFRFH